MDNELVNGLVIIIMSLFMVRWWFITKGFPYRKYILLMSMFWFLTIISYIIAMSFDILVFGIIVIIAFFFFFFFLIRAGLSEYRYKKKMSDE